MIFKAPIVAAIFFMTTFNRNKGAGKAPCPPRILLSSSRILNHLCVHLETTRLKVPEVEQPAYRVYRVEPKTQMTRNTAFIAQFK